MDPSINTYVENISDTASGLRDQMDISTPRARSPTSPPPGWNRSPGPDTLMTPHTFTLKYPDSFLKDRLPGPTAPAREVLDAHHICTFTRAITNVLSTKIAELTLAQLVDGLPVDHVAVKSVYRLHRDHPIEQHQTLCEGALERTQAWMTDFSPSTLQLETRVLQAFQSASPEETRQFNPRLLETTAVAIHQIAVSLFQSGEKLHDDEFISTITSWKPTLKSRIFKDGPVEIVVSPLPAPPTFPTLFYPSGIADMAGYWAEDWIFGGVVLFDRGESDEECKDAWLHSGRRGVTKRVWKVLEHDEKTLFDFLTSNASENVVPCPLPISCDMNNTTRHDAWGAMALHHIYRDPWERKETHEKDSRFYSRHTVFDYPEMGSGSLVE